MQLEPEVGLSLERSGEMESSKSFPCKSSVPVVSTVDVHLRVGPPAGDDGFTTNQKASGPGQAFGSFPFNYPPVYSRNGLQFVKHLSANDENQVFAIVRNKSTANLLRELSRSNVTIVEADVTDATALNAAAAEVAKATNNKLDYLINNTGSNTMPGLTIDRLISPTPEAFEKDLQENLKNNAISVVHSTNAFLPLLKNGSTKKVLTLSSTVGHMGFTLQSDLTASVTYAMAKTAMNIVAKFATIYRADGFIFLSICPGMVDTSPTQTAPPPAGMVAEFKLITESLSKTMSTIPPPISVEESVRMQLEVFNNWPLERSGEMVSHL
ncbi:hypothetical protein R3P38DRAFT_2756588 [Favolaschia claudopus]|uniref:NAD(P)-binding protein n=1 Tax=Favolaschia claudopus TaxID=2862362 RepID=A0AAW0EFJ3_9AGAR